VSRMFTSELAESSVHVRGQVTGTFNLGSGWATLTNTPVSGMKFAPSLQRNHYEFIRMAVFLAVPNPRHNSPNPYKISPLLSAGL
jgi:hypothetical protein